MWIAPIVVSSRPISPRSLTPSILIWQPVQPCFRLILFPGRAFIAALNHPGLSGGLTFIQLQVDIFSLQEINDFQDFLIGKTIDGHLRIRPELMRVFDDSDQSLLNHFGGDLAEFRSHGPPLPSTEWQLTQRESLNMFLPSSLGLLTLASSWFVPWNRKAATSADCWGENRGLGIFVPGKITFGIQDPAIEPIGFDPLAHPIQRWTHHDPFFSPDQVAPTAIILK